MTILQIVVVFVGLFTAEFVWAVFVRVRKRLLELKAERSRNNATKLEAEIKRAVIAQSGPMRQVRALEVDDIRGNVVVLQAEMECGHFITMECVVPMRTTCKACAEEIKQLERMAK
jgi:hypothetical protein